MEVEQETETYEKCIPTTALYFDGQYYILIPEEREGILGKEMVAAKTDVNVLDKTETQVAIEAPISKVLYQQSGQIQVFTKICVYV